ncbi:MAG: low molecular weight protein-tyrosine-phosphatase [Mangrovicoccus sp.]
MPPRILFVCLGNICRSPAAEGVLRAQVPDWEIDSAGTGGWHVGEPPYGPMQEAARLRGYDLSKQRARQFSAKDFGAWDMILVMDGNNLRDVEALRPLGDKTPVARLLDFATEASAKDVPDPYYTRDFNEALDLIEAATQGLVTRLAAQPDQLQTRPAV